MYQVFLSINTLILGASFLFGSAASSYFEGLLLIFVRRPYDIGDKVSIEEFEQVELKSIEVELLTYMVFLDRLQHLIPRQTHQGLDQVHGLLIV